MWISIVSFFQDYKAIIYNPMDPTDRQVLEERSIITVPLPLHIMIHTEVRAFWKSQCSDLGCSQLENSRVKAQIPWVLNVVLIGNNRSLSLVVHQVKQNFLGWRNLCVEKIQKCKIDGLSNLFSESCFHSVGMVKVSEVTYSLTLLAWEQPDLLEVFYFLAHFIHIILFRVDDLIHNLIF